MNLTSTLSSNQGWLIMFDIEQQKQKYFLLYSMFIAQNKDKTVGERFPGYERHEKVKIGEMTIRYYELNHIHIMKIEHNVRGLFFTKLTTTHEPYSKLYDGKEINLFDYISFEDKI